MRVTSGKWVKSMLIVGTLATGCGTAADDGSADSNAVTTSFPNEYVSTAQTPNGDLVTSFHSYDGAELAVATYSPANGTVVWQGALAPTGPDPGLLTSARSLGTTLSDYNMTIHRSWRRRVALNRPTDPATAGIAPFFQPLGRLSDGTAQTP